MISLKKYSVTIIGWMLVIATLSSFIYLTAGEDISPGWTSPAKIQNSWSSPVITYHEGELWVAYFYSEWDTDAIQVIHSRDGKEWCSPIILAEGLRSDVSFGALQWLKRPDGHLWLLWGGRKESEDWSEVLYCSVLENGTWVKPYAVLCLDKEYRITDVGNAPGGGLVVVMKDYHQKYSVLSSNEYFKWNQPFIFYESYYLGWADVFLDRNGTLWLLYEGDLNWIWFRTSEDGNTWSYARKFPLTTVARGVLLQRKSGQFVFILGKDQFSNSISFSQDGFWWSLPTLVVRTGLEESHPTLVVERLEEIYSEEIHSDLTESDDGTLWYVCSVASGIYIMKFSDQKYEEDLHLRNVRTKNEAIFFSVYLLVASAWFILKRSVTHAPLKKNAIYNDIKKHMQNVQKNMEIIESWMFLGAFAFLIALMMRLLAPDIDMLPILVGYPIVFWILSGVSDLKDEKSMKEWKRYVNIIVPLGVFVTILMWYVAALGYFRMPLIPIMVSFLCILLAIILIIDSIEADLRVRKQ